MLSRRELVGKLAVGAAGAAVLVASGGHTDTAVASTRSPNLDENTSPEPVPASETALNATPEAPPPPASAPPPWELLRPLAPGTPVAEGWRLSDLSGPAAGACVLTLQNERGRVQRVHICRNDGRPQGLVHTQRFDLVVMNGGQGDLGTEENLAQAVAAVAHVVAANEDSANGHLMGSFLPHSERLQQFSNTWTLR